MGRRDDQAAQPTPPSEEGGEETPYGMGLSSEHDEGEVQEVDSREED